MTSRRSTTTVAAICLAVSMAASVLLLHRVDEIRPRANIEDALYISSPKMVKRASLGFEGLMACIYWTRTVQYFGDRHAHGSRSYNELAPLLEITTALDPKMIPAYQFGATFLAPAPPNGAGEPRRAVEQADALVAEVIKRLADSFAEERSKLEGQWGRGDDVSTEDLRVSLRRYRSFFDRLLNV